MNEKHEHKLQLKIIKKIREEHTCVCGGVGVWVWVGACCLCLFICKSAVATTYRIYALDSFCSIGAVLTTTSGLGKLTCGRENSPRSPDTYLYLYMYMRLQISNDLILDLWPVCLPVCVRACAFYSNDIIAHVSHR